MLILNDKNEGGVEGLIYKKCYMPYEIVFS